MKKKKVKLTYHNESSGNDDSEEQYQEVDTNVDVSKKLQCPRYIVPMSLNKIAKSAKQHQVIAPKVSDSNITKENHSKATLSMAELISRNKGTRHREASKQKLEKPTCLNSRLKTSLLVDDDDNEDDDIFQVDKEPTGLEDDGDEGYTLRSQGYVDQDDEYDDMDLIASIKIMMRYKRIIAMTIRKMRMMHWLKINYIAPS